MADLTKVLLAQPEQCRAEKLGVAADVVIGMRMEIFAVLVMPHFSGLIFPLKVDRSGVPVVLLPWHVGAAL